MRRPVLPPSDRAAFAALGSFLDGRAPSHLTARWPHSAWVVPRWPQRRRRPVSMPGFSCRVHSSMAAASYWPARAAACLAGSHSGSGCVLCGRFTKGDNGEIALLSCGLSAWGSLEDGFGKELVCPGLGVLLEGATSQVRAG